MTDNLDKMIRKPKHITVQHMDGYLYLEMRKLAITRGVPVYQLINDALREYLERQGKKGA